MYLQCKYILIEIIYDYQLSCVIFPFCFFCFLTVLPLSRLKVYMDFNKVTYVPIYVEVVVEIMATNPTVMTCITLI